MSLFSVSYLKSSMLLHSIDNLLVILLSAAWKDVSGDAAVNRMTQNTIPRIESAAENLRVASRYRYVNYASAAQA